MALTLLITPGSTWPDGTKITLSELRKTAKPSINVSGSVATVDLDTGAVTAPKMQSGPIYYIAETSPGNASAISVSFTAGANAPTAYANGVQVWVKVINDIAANATLNVQSLGAKKVYKQGGVQIAANDIRANQIIHIAYNESLDSAAGGWELISQFDNLNGQYASAGGTANALTAALAPTVKALYSGLFLHIKAAAANTGPATLQIDGLASPPSITNRGIALTGGEIQNGRLYHFVYDGSTFELLNPSAIQDISFSSTGSANTYAGVIPAGMTLQSGLRVRMTATFTNTGAATLNLTPSGGTALGAKSIVLGGANLNGGEIQNGQIIELIYDSANSVFQIANGRRVFVSTLQGVPLAGGSTGNIVHSLGVVPTDVRCVLVNQTSEAGYTANDEVDFASFYSTSTNAQLFGLFADGSNVGLVRNSGATNFVVMNKTTGVESGALTAGNWRVKFYAYA